MLRGEEEEGLGGQAGGGEVRVHGLENNAKVSNTLYGVYVRPFHVLILYDIISSARVI